MSAGWSVVGLLPASDGEWRFYFDSYAVPDDQITTYACRSFALGAPHMAIQLKFVPP